MKKASLQIKEGSRETESWIQISVCLKHKCTLIKSLASCSAWQQIREEILLATAPRLFGSTEKSWREIGLHVVLEGNKSSLWRQGKKLTIGF